MSTRAATAAANAAVATTRPANSRRLVTARAAAATTKANTPLPESAQLSPTTGASVLNPAARVALSVRFQAMKPAVVASPATRTARGYVPWRPPSQSAGPARLLRSGGLRRPPGLQRSVAGRMLLWFVGAIVVRGLLLYPLYALADRSFGAARHRRRRSRSRGTLRASTTYVFPSCCRA